MEVFDEYSWLSARADHAPAVQYPAQLRLVADPVYAAPALKPSLKILSNGC